MRHAWWSAHAGKWGQASPPSQENGGAASRPLRAREVAGVPGSAVAPGLAGCAAAWALSGDERLAVSVTGVPVVSGDGDTSDGFGALAVVLWKAEKSGKITSLCNF